jgi:hypothetical protein
MKPVPTTVAMALLLGTGGAVYRPEPAVPDPEWTRHAANAFAVVEATILDQAAELQRPERRERRVWRAPDGRLLEYARVPSVAAVAYLVRARIDRVLKGPLVVGSRLDLAEALGFVPTFGRGERWLLFVSWRPSLDHLPDGACLQELKGSVFRRPADGRDQSFNPRAARGLEPVSMFARIPSNIRLDRATSDGLLAAVEASISAARDLSPPALKLHVASGTVLRGLVAISLEARDDDGAPRVRVRLGHGPGQTSAKPPYSAMLDTRLVSDGPHDLIAVAEDASGLRTYRAVSVTVANGPPDLPAGDRDRSRATIVP